MSKLREKPEEQTETERKLTDYLDLMVDEFARICALTDDSEIKGLCERAVKNTYQHVPVIEQRNKWQDKYYAEHAELLALKDQICKTS